MIRPTAVAGQFYPASSLELKNQVETFLKKPPLSVGSQMLICPHAGYIFSGPVAGAAYTTISRDIKTVILIGPSHHVLFNGIAVSGYDAWQTPLGNVPLDKARIALLRKSPLTVENRKADDPEHSLEVQLPFLQVCLKDFSIVPILTGEVDPLEVAQLISPLIDDKTLVIASTDLSHYHSDTEAKKIDRESIVTVTATNPDGFFDGCGETAVRVVMELAKIRHLIPNILDARNSHDTAPQFCGSDRVVGYLSVAYSSDGLAANTPDKDSTENIASAKEELSQEEKDWLLTLARQSLVAAVTQKPAPTPVNPPAFTKVEAGCFVTLTIGGELRGCIGYIEPIMPLYAAVIENARSAALSDPRFSPVTPEELSSIVVEVSVLTVPKPLEYSSPEDLLKKIRPNEDGIILKSGHNQSTFLPQVWEQLPDKIQFLTHLSLKAGLPPDGWKRSSVKRYSAIHFKEFQ